IGGYFRGRGSVLMTMGEMDKARAAMRHALSIADNLNNPGMIWPCHIALAELEDTDRQPEAAQVHYRAALEIIGRIAGELTDPLLRERFLNAIPIRNVLAHTKALTLAWGWFLPPLVKEHYADLRISMPGLPGRGQHLVQQHCPGGREHSGLHGLRQRAAHPARFEHRRPAISQYQRRSIHPS